MLSPIITHYVKTIAFREGVYCNYSQVWEDGITTLLVVNAAHMYVGHRPSGCKCCGLITVAASCSSFMNVVAGTSNSNNCGSIL